MAYYTPVGLSGICSDVACRVAILTMPHRFVRLAAENRISIY